jgi:hypothetical protein
VILANSEDNLQRAIHRLNVISTDYNMRRKYPIRIKIVINERIIDQFLNCNHLGYNMGFNREMDINLNYKDFNKYVVQLKEL